MKIAQISDTHIGITTEGQLKVMFRKLQKEEFDVLIHCGDYGGTFNGSKCVKRTVAMMRKYFPDKPILSTIGNHDYWCAIKRKKLVRWDGTIAWMPQSPSPADFLNNLAGIEKTFKDANIHFLDKDGVYKHPNHPEVVVVGASGWYNNPNPPTNDSRWLPIGLGGDTNRYILKTTEDDLFRNAEALKDFETWQTLIFVSHFPVVNAGADYKGRFEEFSWRDSLHQHFLETYGCVHFLCGHAHQFHNGPLRYESGTDYYNPKYQIITV